MLPQVPALQGYAVSPVMRRYPNARNDPVPAVARSLNVHFQSEARVAENMAIVKPFYEAFLDDCKCVLGGPARP